MDDSELDSAMLTVKTNQEKLEDEMGDFDENYDYDQSMYIQLKNWVHANDKLIFKKINFEKYSNIVNC